VLFDDCLDLAATHPAKITQFSSLVSECHSLTINEYTAVRLTGYFLQGQGGQNQ
jgi:hypothetical protein